jgi:hypothetical protein
MDEDFEERYKRCHDTQLPALSRSEKGLQLGSVYRVPFDEVDERSGIERDCLTTKGV